MTQPKFSKGGLVEPSERAEIIRLHGEGKGRNEIARLTQRAQRTVSIICADEGLTFDTTMTEEATRHRIAQLAVLRADTAMDLHVDGMKLTQQMWEPAKIFNFGGKDNTYNEKDVDEPPADVKRSLMTAAGIAFEKSLKLVPPEREDAEGLAAVDQWLRGMMPSGE
ncbi:helix-turn-helix domain-containing protein [Streptomyces prunicolor]|uniref:helix-turn-helix domain-containing protein n=1 Tax=Streptomyces prunicolor TaxID=67348 RepID=UPI0037110522